MQMNDDTYPQVPQNEESVAYSTDDPMIAVAAANDYVERRRRRHADDRRRAALEEHQGPGAIRSRRATSATAATRPSPTAAATMPSISAKLCFFRDAAVFRDPCLQVAGQRSRPGRRGVSPPWRRRTTTRRPAPSTTSFFNDKELIAVDNHPTSPHYGRIYVTYTRFHILADGSSDSCPIQLSYTDDVPSHNPSLSVWTHTSVVPDDFGDDGVGPSANQFSTPVVEKDGALDIAYVLEECDTGLDHELRFQKSTDGGATFLAQPVTVNKPGQWADNPDLADLIPNTDFRTPNTVSLAYSRRTGTLAYVYTNYISGQGNGNIDVSLSHERRVDVVGRQDDQPGGRPSGPEQPVLPLDRRHAARPVRGDLARSASRIRTTTTSERSRPGRTMTARRGGTARISTRTWNPDRGFFTSGAFIGDYSGIAAHDKVVYPVWTDGRRQQHRRNRHAPWGRRLISFNRVCNFRAKDARWV